MDKYIAENGEAEERLVKLLQEYGWKASTAESCTGGAVAAAIVNVAGASDVFEEGFVTYSNTAKRKYLGVKRITLKTLGAVSRDTAAQMCRGCCRTSGAEVGIATTGIAGPGGGTAEKPVGLVYIGCCVHGKVTVKKCRFSGSRSEVRRQTVETALLLAIRCIEAFGDIKG
ncbi:MAG TPA: damage-inducible protein CinA [Lachnospiraceae bacterium]|nr:damage-inducible protein CinA [Lachnospiraceae bacterium]